MTQLKAPARTIVNQMQRSGR